jgi:hypothetical protein
VALLIQFRHLSFIEKLEDRSMSRSDPRRHAGVFEPIDPMNPPAAIKRQAGDFTEAARDVQARLAIVEARKQFMRQLFGGTQLVSDTWAKAQAVGNILSATKNVAKKVNSLVKQKPVSKNILNDIARNSVLKLLQDLFDTDEISEIIEELSEGVVGEIAEAITPFLGAIKNGGKGLVHLGLAAKEAWRAHKTTQRKEAVLPGDARAAAQALREVIVRDATQKAISGGRSLATAGLQVGGVFIDGGVASGPAFGLANSLAGLAQTIFVLARDYKEKKRVNKILEVPENITAKTFMVCPILGAYYLACADTSMIINLLVEDIGNSGWMDNVEKLVKESIDPLVETAVAKLTSYRFKLKRIGEHGEVLELVSNKGTFERGRLAALKRKARHFKNKVADSLKNKFN